MRALELVTQADPRTRPWTGGRRAGWRLSVAGRGADAAAHRARRTRTRRRREGRGQPPKTKEGALLSPALSDLGLPPACPGGPGRTCTGRLGPPTSAGVRERPHTDDGAMGTALPPAPLGLARGPRQSWPECPRPLLPAPRPRAGTTAALPRGMEGLAGARRSGRGDTGRRPGASRFRVLGTVLAAPPSRCPQDVERDRPVRALSPTGPRPAAVHQAVLARLATPSPRETPPLAVPHRRDGGSPSLVAKAHLAAQAALHRGPRSLGLYHPGGCFSIKLF